MPYRIDIKRANQSDQTSFVGGKPRIPKTMEIPTCGLCHNIQTFFYQVAFPAGENWSGESIVTFACTHCAEEDNLIPEMTDEIGADIPSGFLSAYQRNFRFLVFRTVDGELREEVEGAIAFQELVLSKGSRIGDFGKIGGLPHWLMDDESPGRYNGMEMKFLYEVKRGFQFTKLPGARPQVELDLRGREVPSPLSYYQLFLGNSIYIFGANPSSESVYAITQVQ